VVRLLHLKNIKMSCKIEKNAKNGKINGVLNKEGEKSSLFQQIFNTPTLSLNEAIDVYKNIFSDKLKKVEPIQELIVEEIGTLEITKTEIPKVEIKITDEDIKQLVQSGDISYTDEDLNLCAKNGVRGNTFTKGSKWEIVEDLKGASHSNGGIDLQINSEGVTFKRVNGKQITAQDGVLVPFNKNSFNYDIPFLDDNILLEAENPMKIKIAQDKIKKEFESWKQKNLSL